MSNTKFNLLEKIKSNKKIQYLLVGVLSLLLIIALLFGNFNSGQTNFITQEKDYVTKLEDKLSSVLSKVDGAGKVSVVITVESGMETVLAEKTIITETMNGKVIETTPILVNGKTVILKEKFPKIIGVLIVANGANNISILTKIQQATVSLLDINVNQIEILTMK